MFKCFLYVLLSFSLLGSAGANALLVNRSVVIVELHPIAGTRADGEVGNFTRVYVVAAPWGSSTCRQDAADLYKGDVHILSQLIWAISMKKRIFIEVNSSIRPIDTVCQVTALRIMDIEK